MATSGFHETGCKREVGRVRGMGACFAKCPSSMDEGLSLPYRYWSLFCCYLRCCFQYNVDMSPSLGGVVSW